MKTYEKEQKMNIAGDLCKELQELDKLSQSIDTEKGRVPFITTTYDTFLTIICCK